MKLLISGGGTGGHLIPGIALYEEAKSRGIESKYVFRETDLRYTVSERIDPEDRMLVEIAGISRKNLLLFPVYIAKLAKVFFSIYKKIKLWNPDAVLITGGYVSNPVAFTAMMLRKPLYIVEQNSVAGMTNRFYSRFAKTVFTGIPGCKKLKSKKVIQTGNPSIFKMKSLKDEAIQHFGLTQYNRILGISGGSQGAKAVNDAVMGILPKLKETGIGAIWSVGAVDYDRFERDGDLKRIVDEYPNAKPFKFIDRMDLFFSGVDGVISRAGATSVAEYIHFGAPSVLIPIYKSPDDHQLLNAQYLANSGAAIVLEEPEVNAESLWEKVCEMLERKEEMSASLEKIRPNAPAKTILDAIAG